MVRNNAIRNSSPLEFISLNPMLQLYTDAAGLSQHSNRAGIFIVSKSQCITEIHAISSRDRRREKSVARAAHIESGMEIMTERKRGHLRPLQSFVASDETHPRRWSRSASPTPPSATARTAMWSEGLTSFRVIIRERRQGMHQNWRAWCFGTFHSVRRKVPPHCEISAGFKMVGSGRSKYRAFI